MFLHILVGTMKLLLENYTILKIIKEIMQIFYDQAQVLDAFNTN